MGALFWLLLVTTVLGSHQHQQHGLWWLSRIFSAPTKVAMWRVFTTFT